MVCRQEEHNNHKIDTIKKPHEITKFARKETIKNGPQPGAGAGHSNMTSWRQ